MKDFYEFSKLGNEAQFIQRASLRNKAVLKTMKTKWLYDEDKIITKLLKSHKEYRLPCKRCGRMDVTRWKPVKGRGKAFNCSCGYQISALAGTIFFNTNQPLTLWYKAQTMLEATDYKMTAKEIQRILGINYKSAWRMRHLLSGNKLDGGRLVRS